MLLSALQKPLRRIDIEEISGKLTETEVEAAPPLVQEVERKPEDSSSPLSSSPSAKMIKIEEIAEAPSQTSDRCLFHTVDRQVEGKKWFSLMALAFTPNRHQHFRIKISIIVPRWVILTP